MLSTGFSRLSLLRTAALGVAMAVLAACGGPIGGAGSQGVAVDVNAPVRVALLVPYGTGDPGREQIARSLENAARLAQADLRDATIDLAVYPSGGTSAGGQAAAEQAVAEGAKILVGPLFSTETAGAQPVAARAGLSVLSFSNNTQVAGSNVFILGTSFENTADRLVAYGLAHGLRSFGVVYPTGLEGETARDAVRAAIAARGATLAGTQSYNLSVESIQAAAGPAAATLSGAGAQAVILTDGPSGGLAFISEGLRANGLTAAQFLGMQRWDVSAEALAVPALQGGAFAAPDPNLVAAFNGRYQTAYGETPHELAGLAYDGVAAVGALIAQARSQGGSPFSTQRLTQPAGFAGVNGAFRFSSNGRIQRNLAMIEVRNGQAVVAERAARSFDSVGF
ncbi:MAG TPA: penicillin-binding protein activator [Amaricoccus sp.]|nr:penicillin-binding protein activator [Amaricoccus sp.]